MSNQSNRNTQIKSKKINNTTKNYPSRINGYGTNETNRSSRGSSFSGNKVYRSSTRNGKGTGNARNISRAAAVIFTLVILMLIIVLIVYFFMNREEQATQIENPTSTAGDLNNAVESNNTNDSERSSLYDSGNVYDSSANSYAYEAGENNKIGGASSDLYSAGTGNMGDGGGATDDYTPNSNTPAHSGDGISIDTNNSSNNVKTQVNSFDYTYIIREYDGKLAVFIDEQSEPLEVYDTYIADLPSTDRHYIENGIRVSTVAELSAYLEDLTS